MTISGKTKSGFEFEIDDGKVKDFTYVEHVADMTDEEAPDLVRLRACVNFVRHIMGREGLADLKAHVAALHDGVADTTTVMGECMEINGIIQAAGKDAKN